MAVGLSNVILNEFNLDDIDPIICTEPDNDRPWLWWRYLDPTAHADVMIISSYGAVYPQQVKIAEKVVPVDNAGTDRLVLAREEMDGLKDLYKQVERRHIVYWYSECGAGLQMSRDYYINRMRKLFTETNKELVYIFYVGNSEEGSGSWCFKDGVISFQNIYDLYVECFKGKRLSIISDCSYSGRWVKDCVKIYDDQGIPSCGHHSREKGILIKVLSSCKSYQEATIMAFVKEAMKIVHNEVIFYHNKQLSSGQTTTLGDFYMIRCDNKPDMCCQFTIADPWKNKIPGGLSLDLLMLGDETVYIVRAIDTPSCKPAWYLVLADEEKVEAFKEQVETGRIELTEYGEVLYSGWGEDPPQEIMDKMNKSFLNIKIDHEEKEQLQTAAKSKTTLAGENGIHVKWEDLTSVMKEKIYKGLLQEVETLRAQQSANKQTKNENRNLLHETNILQSKLDKKDIEELTKMKEAKAKDKITLGEDETHGKWEDHTSVLKEKIYKGLLQEVETLRAQQSASKKFSSLNAVDKGVQFDYWVPMEDLLHGAKVVDERVFNVQGSGEQFFDWSECGFTLQVPEGALLGTETCAVAVKALVAGNFQLPANTRLISGLYAISAARVFRKPVLTTIQHCLRVERKSQINRMCFIKAHQTHKGMPYVFGKEEGGDFEVGSHNGSFWQYSFSNLGIALDNRNLEQGDEDNPSDDDTDQDGRETEEEEHSSDENIEQNGEETKDKEEDEIQNENMNEDDPRTENKYSNELPSMRVTTSREIDESSSTSGVGTSSINEGTSSIAEDDGTRDDSIFNDSILNDSQSVTTSSSDDCLYYYALTYYEHKTNRVNSYVHRFIAVKNLNSHIKYVKAQPFILTMEPSKSFQFSFARSKEIIKLEFSSTFNGIEGNGWHIQPDCSPSQISKREIDSLGQELQVQQPDATPHVYPAIPMCSTVVYADRGTSRNLNYPVPVKGMKQTMKLYIQRQIVDDHQTGVLSSPSNGSTLPCSSTSISTTVQSIGAETPSCVKNEDVDQLKHIVKDVLTKNEDNMTYALEDSMDDFASKLLTEDLITRAAKDHFTYSVFIRSFLANLRIMEDIKNIECHCSTLIKILNEIGGPPSRVGKLLKKQLIDKVKCELHADFCI